MSTAKFIARARRRECIGHHARFTVRSLLLSSLMAACGHAMAASPSGVRFAESHQPQAPHLGDVAVEGRIKLLAVELNLTPAQQSDVRRILQNQREAVNRIWADSNAPPAYRVAAMRDLNLRTVERIRSVLDEQQRKRYSVPQPVRAPDAGRRSVEQWMSATRQR